MSLRYKGGVISATPPTTTGGTSGTAKGVWTLEQQLQAQAAGVWPEVYVPAYIEDLFQTWLYTGNGSTQTITNGIDLSGEGGLVWIKRRTGTYGHGLIDTVRGRDKVLFSESTLGQQTSPGSGDDLTAFNANGFSVGANYNISINASNEPYASWTFRKAEKFFDVVTYTGTGSARTVSHNLGSVPGVIIVKAINVSGEYWMVYHRSIGNTGALFLQTTGATSTSSTYWNNTSPTSTEFTVGTNGSTNGNGTTYVAYLFAHDAGGFGTSGSDNVITCDTFTTSAGGTATITLGYEPQWLLVKTTAVAGTWQLVDNMRGMPVGSACKDLAANSSAAEGDGYTYSPTATGFTFATEASRTYIYIAIRRGPMKTPTSGTSVFVPYAGSDISAITSNFPVDFFIDNKRSGNASNSSVGTRLLGGDVALVTSSTAATQTGFFSTTWYQSNTTFTPGCFGTNTAVYGFGRAPGFFDVVCYTGTGVTDRVVTHNLGVAPELIITKCRSHAEQWGVGTSFTSTSYKWLYLALTNAALDLNYSAKSRINSQPTSTQYTIATDGEINQSAYTYVAYLFATVAGVSKVGSYTGTGTTLQVNCGFTGGARFVLIKRTDSTGDWYVWDSARGIVAGNDPYLLLNSTAAEVTNTDYVDTYSAGFEISSTAPAAINANGGTYLFLAIA